MKGFNFEKNWGLTTIFGWKELSKKNWVEKEIKGEKIFWFKKDESKKMLGQKMLDPTKFLG